MTVDIVPSRTNEPAVKTRPRNGAQARKLASALPAGFSVRPVRMVDLEAAVELFNACAVALIGRPDTRLEDMRNEWLLPKFDLEGSTRVVLSPEGQIVGYVEVWDLQDLPTRIWVWGRVHPEFEDLGIGTHLMTWAEERARLAIPRVPEDVRVAIQSGTVSTYEPAKALLSGFGMKLVRHFWNMEIELDQVPPEPNWAEGITVRTMIPGQEERAIIHAVRDAFKDHWGYVEQPFETEFEHWMHFLERDEDFDPTLWFLAMDGNEIAGVSLCWPKRSEDPEMGWVGTLGVRRPWRRKGLGLALLHHSFGEFRRRGQKRVGLGVDAASLTGATRLYEKAGMHVARQFDNYEKELRPGRDVSTQSVDA